LAAVDALIFFNKKVGVGENVEKKAFLALFFLHFLEEQDQMQGCCNHSFFITLT